MTVHHTKNKWVHRICSILKFSEYLTTKGDESVCPILLLVVKHGPCLKIQEEKVRLQYCIISGPQQNQKKMYTS